jgi:hypothetical protein
MQTAWGGLMKKFLVVLVGCLLTVVMATAGWAGVMSLDEGGAGATASFYDLDKGPHYSHVHWGSTGDWYIRSAKDGGKVVLQDSVGSVVIGPYKSGFEKLMVSGNTAISGYLTLKGLLWADGGILVNTGAESSFNGPVVIYNIPVGSSGSTPLCRDNQDVPRIVYCGASSRAYKDNIEEMKQGLEAVSRLRPVTFTWKKTGEADLGFIAEEVAEVAPLLTMYNKEGAPEGVKYPYVTTVLVKAVQEQQAMLQEKEQRIQKLEKALELLTKKVAELDAPARRVALQ